MAYNYYERVDDGYPVLVQYCIKCGKYLGANFPDEICPDH